MLYLNSLIFWLQPSCHSKLEPVTWAQKPTGILHRSEIEEGLLNKIPSLLGLDLFTSLKTGRSIPREAPQSCYVVLILFSWILRHHWGQDTGYMIFGLNQYCVVSLYSIRYCDNTDPMINVTTNIIRNANDL